MREHEQEGIMMRAKCTWHEAGEKPTKYFCSLMKQNYANKVISHLEVNGKMIYDQKDILEKQKEYYEKLYTSKGTDWSRQAAFINDKMAVLDIDQRDLCEGLIKEQEAKQVLKDMANSKSPGFDGYTVEFYKFFWKDLGTFVVRSLNYAFQNGH